ncbi:hypothetical protein AKJ65_01455 [candidate division MSBL1 archaeon SCGC-AAA259E19]|uniref:histidine kinase n=1 Tax=candidate division MSBL1 archaeon SCGC-AAA259E19 TaxID=1698264 RepID=A0A133UN34_9EURY|nr:hypothetical protein AKJ65_01455 [candidate division MSBL1 archaeon SCGC-AAA259E19]
MYSNEGGKALLSKWEVDVDEFIPNRWQEVMGTIFENGKAVNKEVEVGEKIYSITINPISDQGYANLYASDITDLKKTEEKLEKERDLLNKITETSPVGITVLDTEGQIVFANEEAERVLGLPEEEVTRRTFDDAKWKITDYEGDPFPKEELPFRKVMETKEPVYDVRHAIEWPSGERKLLSVNAAPIFDSTGDLDKIVATIENVTEREQNRRKLQESNLQLEAIFNDPEVFVGILDSDGTVLKANEAALAFVGASHSEIEGEKFWNTPWWEHSPELQEKLRKGIERAKTGEIVRFEATHIGKNEKEITWFSGFSGPIFFLDQQRSLGLRRHRNRSCGRL